MATVRLNDTIRTHIKDKLSKLFSARILAATAKWDQIDVQAIVYKYCTTDQAELDRLLSVPPKWITECAGVQLQITDVPDGKTHNFRLTPKKPVKAPPDAGSSPYYPQCTVKVPFGSPEADLCLQIKAESEAIEKERNALLNGPIVKAVDECSTLKQLLEVWPTALDFVDGPTRAKHAEKHVSREKKAKAQREVLAIPTDVQVQLITARMTSQ